VVWNHVVPVRIRALWPDIVWVGVPHQVQIGNGLGATRGSCYTDITNQELMFNGSILPSERSWGSSNLPFLTSNKCPQGFTFLLIKETIGVRFPCLRPYRRGGPSQKRLFTPCCYNKRYSHSGDCVCLPSRISPWVRVPHTAPWILSAWETLTLAQS
jgi:hypothetical protein